MKEIPLTRGKFALVDDADFAAVSQYKWYAEKHRQTFYARRALPGTSRPRKYQFLHQFLMLGVIRIDHRDRNGLNNQRQNLRPATASANMQNRAKQMKPCASRFKGVNRLKGKWVARVALNGRRVFLGQFDSEEAAAGAYDAAAIKHFGEFALTNARLGLFK